MAHPEHPAPHSPAPAQVAAPADKTAHPPAKVTLRDSLMESKDNVNPSELAWRLWLAERLEDRDLPEVDIKRWAKGLAIQGFAVKEAHDLTEKDLTECGMDKKGVVKAILQTKDQVFKHEPKPVPKEVEKPKPAAPAAPLPVVPPKRSKKPRWYIITFLESLYTKTSGELWFDEGEWFFSTNGQRFPYKGHIKLSAEELFDPPAPKPTLWSCVRFQKRDKLKIVYKVKEEDPLKDDTMLESSIEVPWKESDTTHEIKSTNGKVTFKVRILMHRNDEW